MQKSDRSPAANSRTLSQLPSRNSPLDPRASAGLESAPSVRSVSSAAAAATPPRTNGRTPRNEAPADTTPESTTIDKSPIHAPPANTFAATHVEIRSASTLSETRSKHSPPAQWQAPRRDAAPLPRAAHANHVRSLRPLHSSTHIQFAASILETFPHGFPEEHPSPSREMRGTNGIHQLALASAPQLTRELMDALPPEPKSGTSPISTQRTAYRRSDSDTLASAAVDLSPRAAESAMAVLQHMVSYSSRERLAAAAASAPGSSAGIGGSTTLPRRGSSQPLLDAPPSGRRVSNTQSTHLSSGDRVGGSGSEIEAADASGMGAMPPFASHANRAPPRHGVPPLSGGVHARGPTSSRWLQPRQQDSAHTGHAWRLQSSQGSDITSGEITGTPDTDMTQTQLPLPPGNMGGHSANIGASPFVPTPRRMAVGGQGAQLNVGGGDGARALEPPPGAAMHALTKYRARVAAQVQGQVAGVSSGTDTASGLAGGTATMGDLSAGHSSWLEGTGDLTPPPPHASSDEKLDHIDAQLDSLSRETVLHVYQLFGGSERRRGGAQLPHPPPLSGGNHSRLW